MPDPARPPSSRALAHTVVVFDLDGTLSDPLEGIGRSGGDIGVHKWQQLAALRAQALVDNDAVMVGDRAIDVDAAHRNALHACGVRWGFGSFEELSAARPRYLCEAPGDIVALLSRQGGLAA